MKPLDFLKGKLNESQSFSYKGLVLTPGSVVRASHSTKE